MQNGLYLRGLHTFLPHTHTKKKKKKKSKLLAHLGFSSLSFISGFLKKKKKTLELLSFEQNHKIRKRSTGYYD